MSILPRRTVFPDVVDWFEEPFLTLRPYLAQPIRVEEYAEDGRYPRVAVGCSTVLSAKAIQDQRECHLRPGWRARR